jgi:ketosteroid isomerase-like protein
VNWKVAFRSGCSNTANTRRESGTSNWEFDGSKAAIRWRATVHLVTSGQSYTTELADFLELEDGKLVSCTEFLDTALAG